MLRYVVRFDVVIPRVPSSASILSYQYQEMRPVCGDPNQSPPPLLLAEAYQGTGHQVTRSTQFTFLEGAIHGVEVNTSKSSARQLSSKTHADMERKKGTPQSGRGRCGRHRATRIQTRRLSVTKNGRHDVCG